MTHDPSQLAPAPIEPSEPSPASMIAVVPRPRSRGVLDILLVLAAVLAVGGVAFAVGRSTAPANGFPGGGLVDGNVVLPGGSFAPGPGGPRVGLGGNLSIGGTVTAIDADSITLTLENGDEQTLAIDGTTTYRAASEATADDVAVGDDVSVTVDATGRIVTGGPGASGAPQLTAGEITVAR